MMSIEPHTNETQTRWDRGQFQVMIQSASTGTTIGFCNGEAADEHEIYETAMREGTEVEIDKKLLKTGRQIWTVRPTASFG
jgi:hypothetical protein